MPGWRKQKNMCVKVLFSLHFPELLKSPASANCHSLISQEENIQKECLMKVEGLKEHTVHHPSHDFKFITCIDKERILIYSVTKSPLGFFIISLLLFKGVDWDLVSNTSCSFSPK